MPTDFKKIIPLFLIVCLGAILRFNNLSSRSIWTDEIFTLFQSTGHAVGINNLLPVLTTKAAPRAFKAGELKAFLRINPAKGLNDVSEGLLKTDTHPPLYFWIIHLWMKLFGGSLASVRLFSVLMGILVIWLAYRLGRSLFGQNAGLGCALFVSISAFCVRYSQEARSYSLVMVIGLCAWLAALRLEKDNKNLDAFLFAVINAAGIYTHYFYAFISSAQFLYFTLIYRNDKSRLEKFYLAFLGSLLLFLPWFKAVLSQGYNFRNLEWAFGYPGLKDKIFYLASGLARYIAMFELPAIWQYGFLPAALFLFLSFFTFGIREAGKFPRQIFCCALMFLLPLLAMFFIDLLQQGALLRQERFWVFSLPGFIPFAGLCLSRAFSRWKIPVYAAVSLMIISAAEVSFAQFGPAPKYTSSWINRESRNLTSAVLVYNMRGVVLAQAYYLNNDIYLIPVYDEKQLREGFNLAAGVKAEKVFVARHFHPTDSSLLDQSFMGARGFDSGLKFKQEASRDSISVSEYAR